MVKRSDGSIEGRRRGNQKISDRGAAGLLVKTRNPYENKVYEYRDWRSIPKEEPERPRDRSGSIHESYQQLRESYGVDSKVQEVLSQVGTKRR